MNKQINRGRVIYFSGACIAGIFGLASRSYGEQLPVFLAENAGDVLWAIMVYFGCRFLFASYGMHFGLVISLLFCFGIEFSQLYHANWINSIRQNTIGALILGKGFLVIDLIRYMTGIGIAYLLDFFIVSNSSNY